MHKKTKSKAAFRKVMSLLLAITMTTTSVITPGISAFAADDINSAVVDVVVPENNGDAVVEPGNAEETVVPDDTQTDADSSVTDSESGSVDPPTDESETPPDGSDESTEGDTSQGGTDSDSSSDSNTDSDSSSDSDSDSNSGSDSSSDVSSGEGESGETDSDSSETLPEEDETESEGETPEEEFQALDILASEPSVKAEVGEEVVFSIGLSRDDVAVEYQWQRIQTESQGITSDQVIFDYEDSPTWYSFLWEDTTEAQYVSNYPDVSWQGVEMYWAIVGALDEAGLDSSNVSIEWKTPNYVLDGYTISAAQVGDHVEIYADKDNQRFVALLNGDGKWQFNETATDVAPFEWENIEGATESEYKFLVTEDDYDYYYRCKITIVDENYKTDLIAVLEEAGTPVENPEEPQYLYGPSMDVYTENEADDISIANQAIASMYAVAGGRATTGNPRLSKDLQWIEGLTGYYQYITKDTYDRLTDWINKAANPEEKANRQRLSNMCWTSLTPGGFEFSVQAPVLDDNGYPTNEMREYKGFNLTNGALEVNSEWYGKTVYFRMASGSNPWSNTGTAISIPAFTHLKTDDQGNYIEATSGEKYKEAITILNPYVIDVGKVYETFYSHGGQVTGPAHEKGLGWVYKDGKATDSHITFYSVNCEDFNKDPNRYMMDAEGNYRVDSVAWGVCCYEEPDLSGKAYWALKDYLSQGYGFLVGHDAMYAYAGSYYDAYDQDLRESTIDPNDTVTWYYDINSWKPTATSYNRNPNNLNDKTVAATTAWRGGHFYMNQLIGSNAGNVYSGTVSPYDAPSMILSTGGSHGIYGKLDMLYGSSDLRIVQTGFTAEQAINQPKYRTPTNYPFAFSAGQNFKASHTHTNQQAAFGPVWVNYISSQNAKTWNIDGVTGTQNFYLSGLGNFLMNQIGHAPRQSTTFGESRLFINSLFYISQRKQCEICASGQGYTIDSKGNKTPAEPTSHFVRRINSANAKEVLTALQNGGTYWYPLDGCYMLTDDLDLRKLFGNDWKGIANFSGHWNSDVYKVTLPDNGTPLLINTVGTIGQYNVSKDNGWNLGTNKYARIVNVHKLNDAAVRTTGVARVVGDLNDLFNTHMNYSDYEVRFYGKDNIDLLDEDMVFTCRVNSDSKYVVSNLPCCFNDSQRTGILKARVFDPNGNEVTKYGSIRADVSESFWDNDMTTPLYLGGFAAAPLEDEEVYESMKASYTAVGTADEPITFKGFEYRETPDSPWKPLPADWDITLKDEKQYIDDIGDHVYKVTIVFNNCEPAWDNYEFRGVFTSPLHGTWNTYEYWIDGATGYDTPMPNAEHKEVKLDWAHGLLKVNPWPAKATQDENKRVFEGSDATFTSTGFALADGGNITAEWEYGYVKWNEQLGEYLPDWTPITGSNEFNGTQEIVTSTPRKVTDCESVNIVVGNADYKDQGDFYERAPFYEVETKIKVKGLDIAQDGIHFRVHYTAVSPLGTKVEWYSNIADEKIHAWNTESGAFYDSPYALENHSSIVNVSPPALAVVTQLAAKYPDSAANEDFMTPDPYGQTLLIKGSESSVIGPAVYRAIVYYHPKEIRPNISWQYRTMLDETVREWNQETLNTLYPGTNATVQFSERDLGIAGSDSPYEGYYMIECTMTLTNAPTLMYSSETMMKYFFRCFATTSYSTSKEPDKTIHRVDKWQGLTMDHDISIQHQGVFGYNNENKLTNNLVSNHLVHSLNEVAESTLGAESTIWMYPKLKISVPTDKDGNPTKKINTVIVKFDPSIPFDGRDSMWYDKAWIANNGIELLQAKNSELIFISKTKDAVKLETWEALLRDHVSFTVYDPVDYRMVAQGQLPDKGVKVIWHVDEARLTGAVNTDTGKIYEVRTSAEDLTWDEANRDASTYNADLQLAGKLAEINNAEENGFIHNLVGNSKAWIGGRFDGTKRYWAGSGEEMTYTNFASGYNQTNEFMVMLENGTWDFFSGNTGVAFNNVPVEGASGFVRDWGTRWSQRGGSIVIPEGYRPYVSSWSGIYQLGLQGTFGSGYEGNVHAEIFMIDNNGTERKVWSERFGGWQMPPTWQTGVSASTTTGLREMYVKVSNYAALTGYKCWTQLINCHISGERPGRPPVNKYIVEYDMQGLGMAVTSHSAEDTDRIGTKAIPPDITPGKISAVIIGNEKIYDGTPIEPENFMVSGEGARLDLFKITYSPKYADNYADYTQRICSGENWRDTGAINATVYHAKVSLTEEAIKEGYTLDTDNSSLECDLIIRQRPVDVFSYDNNKIYDGTANGVIKNIQFKPATTGRGVLAQDTVQLNTRLLMGYYTSDGINPIEDAGDNYVMTRSKNTQLFVLHNETSDPHHNYYLDKEDYRGSIEQRPVVVHSRYLDDPTDPRNVKEYDGTEDATITRFIIDNLVVGDDVGLKDSSIFGVYKTSDAGETLNPDGTVKEDRLLHLEEYTITPVSSAVLEGEDAGNYYIEREEYTGAICRTLLEGRIKIWRGVYGQGMDEAAWVSKRPFTASNNLPEEKSWLSLSGLVGSDTLVLNDALSHLVAEGLTTPQIQKDTYVGDYTLSYEGLNEANYPVLSNYLVQIYDGLLSVEPREIVIQPNDNEKMTGDANPNFYSNFFIRNTDGSLVDLGSDETVAYGAMQLIGQDTVESTIDIKMPGREEYTPILMTNKVSNIEYATEVDETTPAAFLDPEDTTLYPCDFCEKYYNTKYGTDHGKLAGYVLEVNRKDTGRTMHVVPVTNSLGEEVQNYTIKYLPGTLVVHPPIRYILNVTVPMYVCMYGFGGDGEVVEPTNYGITNYTENVDVRVTDIEVFGNGWNIVKNDKGIKDLKAGEMTMKIHDTNVVEGHNAPHNPDGWLIDKAISEGVGTYKALPMQCYIAGGNVNEEGCTYVTHIKYTIAPDFSRVSN